MELKTCQAVRVATHRALEARERLLQEYPAWSSWRQQAHALKAKVMARLPDYLDLLAKRVQEWGGQVLWAKDAAEARAHILAVAKRHGAKKVVKSKSMTTEEIKLNPALQDAGLTVTETDLGEFLIQLAGQPPSHLTAPALHLDRYQIGSLLKEHLGLSCPPDPRALTSAASQYLRPCYAQADLGITGINFAAAEDGILIMIENEGNLRQSACRPPVHLALMGLEKLLPTLPDVEVCLRLLPASATGQRLTALVHFLKGIKSGPRGDQVFYLVILDNGRRRLAAHPDLQEGLFCLRCGACLNICPIFQLGSAHLYQRVYPGAIGILLANYLAPLGDISDLCTQCGACGDICPVAIDLPEKILPVRRQSSLFRRVRALSRLAGGILARPARYRLLDATLRRWSARLAASCPAAFVDFALSPESFHQQMRHFGRPLNGTIDPVHTPDHESGGGRGVIRRSGDNKAGKGLPKELPFSSTNLVPSLELLRERLQTVNGVLLQAADSSELACLLAQGTTSPLWLEDHPWLRAAAPIMTAQGVGVCFPESEWAPEADTVVTIALGAVPELGAVLAPDGGSPNSWLPFQARRHIVIVPHDQAGLTLSQALKRTAEAETPLITWLTGPTRTADIEKALLLGAQGPAEMKVVIYSP